MWPRRGYTACLAGGGTELGCRASWAWGSGEGARSAPSSVQTSSLMLSSQSHMDRSLGPTLDASLEGKRGSWARISRSKGQEGRTLAPSWAEAPSGVTPCQIYRTQQDEAPGLGQLASHEPGLQWAGVAPGAGCWQGRGGPGGDEGEDGLAVAVAAGWLAKSKGPSRPRVSVLIHGSFAHSWRSPARNPQRAGPCAFWGQSQSGQQLPSHLQIPPHSRLGPL